MAAKAPATLHNQSGMVLVLAMFMLALLTMIGMASMMSTTTEIDIAGNERVYKTSFYQAEAGLVGGAEIIELLDGQYVADPVYGDNNTTLITVLDPEFLFDAVEETVSATTGAAATTDTRADINTSMVDTDNQSTDAIASDMAGSRLGGGGTPSGVGSSSGDVGHDIELSGDHRAFVDVDKIGSREPPGGGAEFGAGYAGGGASSKIVLYEIQSLGVLPGGGAASTYNRMGFELVISN